MAWCRQDVRHSVPGQELVASERLLGHRGKGKNGKPYPKEEDKTEEQDPKEEKCGCGSGCPLCQAQKKEADPPHHQEPMENQQQQKPFTQTTTDKAPHSEYAQNQAAMGTGDGETE